MPLFKANTVNPKRLYEIIKGVSLKKKDLGHISITHDGISVKAGAIGQFQAVSFIPREFFYSYVFNGTEPLEIVVSLKDLYWILGIAQNEIAPQDQSDEEFIPPEYYLELGDQIPTENGDKFFNDEYDEFNCQNFEASFEYERSGATLDVTLFDDTNSNMIKIIPLLQDPLHDIPEPPNKVIYFKISCSELKSILRDCFKTGSNFQLNGYRHEIIILRFSSHNEYRVVEHKIKADAFYQCKINEDFQFTYSRYCIQPLLSLPTNVKSNIEVVIYTNGLMKMKFCPSDIQNSYVDYMVSAMVEDE